MRAVALALTVAAFAAGCGSEPDEQGSSPSPSSSSPSSSAPATTTKAKPSPPRSRARKRVAVTVVDSQFGRILADRRGQAVYLFAKEKRGASECYGACARAWPPVLAKGDPVGGAGTRGGLVGTTRRRDGRLQVTYRGRPVYLYVDDSPGKVLCHNVNEFGGLWLVVRPNGR